MVPRGKNTKKQQDGDNSNQDIGSNMSKNSDDNTSTMSKVSKSVCT
jgi:hypothetical protein